LPSQMERRKAEHLRISLEENVRANVHTGFEDVHLVHRALPEVDRDRIHLNTTVFKHEFSAPVFIGAITGGTRVAKRINSFIAEAVEELGLGMGVGSQRAALENPKLASTYKIVRKKAQSAFLIANIGAPQLSKGYRVQEAQKAVDMIEADALAIHLNPLQEAIQPEGEAKYRGVLRKIAEIVDALQIPVVVKETGAGISAEVASKLEKIGVQGIDVSGAGGTSWAAVEYYRAKTAQDSFREKLGKRFWDWGIPTAASVVETSRSTNTTVIASGGVRTGKDVAKSLALGASLACMSTPILKPATINADKVKEALDFVIEELRNTMFLVGAENLERLKKSPAVILGRTADWLKQRGFKPEAYARR